MHAKKLRNMVREKPKTISEVTHCTNNTVENGTQDGWSKRCGEKLIRTDVEVEEAVEPTKKCAILEEVYWMPGTSVPSCPLVINGQAAVVEHGETVSQVNILDVQTPSLFVRKELENVKETQESSVKSLKH